MSCLLPFFTFRSVLNIIFRHIQGDLSGEESFKDPETVEDINMTFSAMFCVRYKSVINQ